MYLYQIVLIKLVYVYMIMQMDIVYLNIVSRPDDKPLELTTIEHAAFSPDGLWLATVSISYCDDHYQHLICFVRLRQEMTRRLLLS